MLPRAPIAAILGTALLCLVGSASQAWEPPPARWTRVSDQTVPSHLVHHATVTIDEAAELLERADVALLFDRADGIDLIPSGDLRFRNMDGFNRQERFRIAHDERGVYGLWDAWRSDMGKPARLAGPTHPVLRILGLPTGGAGGRVDPAIPYDPVLVEMPDGLFVIRRVSLRVRDPMDPTRDTAPAQLVTGTRIPLDGTLPDERSTYRMVLHFRGSRTPLEPRIWFLPIHPDGSLDVDREGVLMRVSVTAARVDPWSRELDDALSVTAVRVHLGDRSSLKAWIAALPPADRRLYTQPGSPGDPLLAGPRTRRAPFGAGLQVRSGGEGRVTVLEPFDTGPPVTGVRPQFSGVDIEAWFGRASLGGSVSHELAAVQVGVRAGSMRDTDSTSVALEIAAPLGEYAPERRLGISGVVRARRRTGTSLLQRTVEVGSDLRAGNLGFDYRGLAGLRMYTGRGTVITPTAFVGFRYGLPVQRGEAIFGLALDGAFNANSFRKPPKSAAASQGPRPHRTRLPGARAADPAAPQRPVVAGRRDE